MSIEEVLSKISKVEGISAEDIEALKGLAKKPDESDKEREIKEAKATASRILAEKKALQEKITGYEEQLEQIKSGGLSEQEKLKKELEKLSKVKETMEKELNETKANHLKVQRDYKLEKIGGKVKFLDTIPEELRKYSISSAFKDVEDLEDEKEVEKVLGTFTDAYKGIIASDSAARGTGDKQTNVVVAHGKDISKMSPDERAADLREKRKAGRI